MINSPSSMHLLCFPSVLILTKENIPLLIATLLLHALFFMPSSLWYFRFILILNQMRCSRNSSAKTYIINVQIHANGDTWWGNSELPRAPPVKPSNGCAVCWMAVGVFNHRGCRITHYFTPVLLVAPRKPPARTQCGGAAARWVVCERLFNVTRHKAAVAGKCCFSLAAAEAAVFKDSPVSPIDIYLRDVLLTCIWKVVWEG